MTSEAPAAGDAPASDDAAVPPQFVIDDVASTLSAPANAAPVPGGGKAAEIGGRNGPEPTRYGDWEMRGRCIDF